MRINRRISLINDKPFSISRGLANEANLRLQEPNRTAGKESSHFLLRTILMIDDMSGKVKRNLLLTWRGTVTKACLHGLQKGD